MNHHIVVVAAHLAGKQQPEYCTYIIAHANDDRSGTHARIEAIKITHANFEMMGISVERAIVIACRPIEGTVAITPSGERVMIDFLLHTTDPI